MRLAYLTTSYPEVSHTFIRREILEVERLGHEVDRLSIRAPESVLVDAEDVSDANRTWYCLPRLKSEIWGALLVSPLKLLTALVATIQLARLSHRGPVVNLAYLVEALLVARRLREQDVDHLHVHFGTNAATVAYLARLLGGPTWSMTIHGPAEFDSAIGFSLERKIESAAFVVAITDYCGAQLRRWVTPEHWDKIRVVHCAVPDSLLERARPVDPDCKTIACIGRLCEQKGQLLLLEALRRVLDGGDELRLVLGGDGEMRGLIEERIAALDLTDHVEITGWIDADEVATRLLASRAMVLPSFAEGLPVVIMESLAVGRPVLSTYIAGIPELVEPGAHGWLVPAGSVDALVEALREVARTPTDRLDEMGRAGTAAVRARHHLPTEVSRLEKCFQEFVHT